MRNAELIMIAPMKKGNHFNKIVYVDQIFLQSSQPRFS